MKTIGEVGRTYMAIVAPKQMAFVMASTPDALGALLLLLSSESSSAAVILRVGRQFSFPLFSGSIVGRVSSTNA